MSFGFSVGDFITAIELANKIRKEFVDAPSQVKAVSDEIRGLSIVLQDADIAFPKQELNTDQKRDLEAIDKGCRNVLNELQRILDKHSELGSEYASVGKRIKRVWKRLNWKPEDIDELRSRISTNIGFLNAFNGRLTRDNVVKLVRHQEDQGRQTVLNWLTPIDFGTQQSDFISRREAGTGQWLLKSAEFQEWVETSQQVLFCPGIPGAGKTILSSIVVDYLYANFQKDTNTGIAYLYCNFRRQDEQNADGLLASLLKQLAQGQYPLPESVKSLYDSHKEKRTRPTLNEISSTLQSVAALYSRSFIVVDALDECQASDGCRTKLLTEIFALQTKSKANILSTSRFIPEIDVSFKTSMRLEIRASDHDVQRYLDGHMSELSTCVLRSLVLQSEIKAEIVKAVNGMFLLAQLHFDSLKDKKSPKAIRTALKDLSTGNDAYDDAYNDAMERIEGQLDGDEKLAKQVLSWITCASRPLTTVELAHALGVELGELEFDKENLSPIEDIVSVCAGLVTVDEESAVIRLVHYTTQEYFERTQKRWFPDAEANIATICVTYLSFNDFENGICENDDDFEERLTSNPLYDYASHHWGHHVRKGFTLIAEVCSFLEKNAQVEASSQALLNSKFYPEDSGYSWTPLSWAARNGHEAVVQLLLGKGAEVEAKDEMYGQTPLSLAAESGHEAVVQLLLGKGAEVETKDQVSGRTPLSLAAESGHEAVVQLLLGEGAEVETKDQVSGRTPLSLAAESGHEAVVQLLLGKGAEVETKDQVSGRTPLSLAAESGHEAVVQLLLGKGAEVETKDQVSGRTPLSLAAESGHEAVVQLLLGEGAEVETKDEMWIRTPLSWAAESGHEAVVQLLLGEGAEVETKDEMWIRTPLSWAAESGHEAVVQQLLEEGAEVDAKDKMYGTPLSLAAESGHEAVVQLLLGEGAEVETKDKMSGRTPLSLAAESGHEAVVQLLLGEGAEVETKDKMSGRTPLSLAAESGHEAVVQLLLGEGAEVETKDKMSGRTPLSLAAESGHEAVVQLLLGEGAEVETKDKMSGRTPLSLAAESGHEAVVQLLLGEGAEVETKDKMSGRTPLSLAAESGHEAVVQLLLGEGAEVETKDKMSGRTPLSLAAESGHEAVVQLLLGEGAEVDAKDRMYGRTPLSWAAESGHEAVVQQLLEEGAEVDAKDKMYGTPLSLAAESGHEAVVQLLLEQGAEVDAKDTYGRTPLFLAGRSGHEVVEKLLLRR
ncbi:hypothetical protein V496_00421 [Pseudogymnoascus sp. VKM F-4515 (FW-2607)]|nr:hypothetical protein V496_00421 [Pseudogymnoascus sp. VKM F-4515 (FW-2607)]